jgi:hypothetical protein
MTETPQETAALDEITALSSWALMSIMSKCSNEAVGLTVISGLPMMLAEIVKDERPGLAETIANATEKTAASIREMINE